MDTVTAAPAGTELEGMTAELPAPKGTVVEPDGEIGQCPWTSVAWIAAGDAQLESTEGNCSGPGGDPGLTFEQLA